MFDGTKNFILAQGRKVGNIKRIRAVAPQHHTIKSEAAPHKTIKQKMPPAYATASAGRSASKSTMAPASVTKKHSPPNMRATAPTHMETFNTYPIPAPKTTPARKSKGKIGSY